MKCTPLKLFLGLCLLPLAALAGDPAFNGCWRLDTEQSTALDGWTGLDLVIHVDGPKVALRYNADWRETKDSAVDTVDTSAPVDIVNFFRIEQRHMDVHARRNAAAHVKAAWLDGGRTLRVEAMVPLEISQGNTVMRLYDEFRLLEGDKTLVLIELLDSRSQPLVYHFTKVPDGDKK